MKTMSSSSTAAGADAPTQYSPPTTGALIDLFLDANEGPGDLLDAADLSAALTSDRLRRYPSPAPLERQLAERWGVKPSQLVVTAGGDEAIDRVCRAFLGPGKELVLPTPTFEMIARYAKLTGATIRTTQWEGGPYPIDAVLRLVTDRTGVIAIVSPNNPTGAVATARDLQQLAAAAPQAMLLVDLAYAEFADEDLTAAALSITNAIVIRTFSKAFGLAALRVGYALGSETAVRALRASGSPYPVSGTSLAIASQALRAGEPRLLAAVERIRGERECLFKLLVELGASPRRSQGNFVLAEFADAEWVWRALATLGIGVRRFSPEVADGLGRSLRVTCPGNARSFARLNMGLRAAMRPQALIFDMDGVLADVSGSYRRAITLTAESFGVSITPSDISAAKTEGNANNDWELTQRLLMRRGVSAPLGEVTGRFEALYHGCDGTRGLHEVEKLIPDRALLERLGARLPLAIVTGRPRRDCDRFLARFELTDLFSAVVCMEDAPAKPDPESVRRALKLLSVEAAWMIGDTPDDAVSARAAGVVPLGIVPPGDSSPSSSEALKRAGVARILTSLLELEIMLP